MQFSISVFLERVENRTIVVPRIKCGILTGEHAKEHQTLCIMHLQSNERYNRLVGHVYFTRPGVALCYCLLIADMT